LGDGMEWPDGSLLIPTHRAVIRSNSRAKALYEAFVGDCGAV